MLTMYQAFLICWDSDKQDKQKAYPLGACVLGNLLCAGTLLRASEAWAGY